MFKLYVYIFPSISWAAVSKRTDPSQQKAIIIIDVIRKDPCVMKANTVSGWFLVVSVSASYAVGRGYALILVPTKDFHELHKLPPYLLDIRIGVWQFSLPK